MPTSLLCVILFRGRTVAEKNKSSMDACLRFPSSITNHTVVSAQDFPPLPKHPVSLPRLRQLLLSSEVQIRDLQLKSKDYHC